VFIRDSHKEAQKAQMKKTELLKDLSCASCAFFAAFILAFAAEVDQ
jgi:hypothetical protein